MKKFTVALAVLALFSPTARADDTVMYLKGVFCNTQKEAQEGFEAARAGIPVVLVLAALNKDNQECNEATTIEYIVREVTFLPNVDEKLDGKQAYFYKAKFLGVRNSNGTVMPPNALSHTTEDLPAVYFERPEPFNPQDVNART